jgi:hypothetical protein
MVAISYKPEALTIGLWISGLTAFAAIMALALAIWGAVRGVPIRFPRRWRFEVAG